MNEENRDAARRFVELEMQKKGWNRSRLASEAKVDPKTLRAFLDGSRWPQEDKRISIARALGWEGDEIDHIEDGGEHRFTVQVVRRDDPTDIRTWRRSTNWRDADLTARYVSAVEFAAIAEGHPALEQPASDFIDAAIALWRAARALAEGGDGDAYDTGGSAPTSEPVAAHDDPQDPPGAPEE